MSGIDIFQVCLGYLYHITLLTDNDVLSLSSPRDHIVVLKVCLCSSLDLMRSSPKFPERIIT
jgi:hypothetical protein